MKIILRIDAIKKGLEFYFTGIACKNGHVEKRRTINGCCAECERNGVRRHREKIKLIADKNNNKKEEK